MYVCKNNSVILPTITAATDTTCTVTNATDATHTISADNDFTATITNTIMINLNTTIATTVTPTTDFSNCKFLYSITYIRMYIYITSRN